MLATSRTPLASPALKRAVSNTPFFAHSSPLTSSASNALVRSASRNTATALSRSATRRPAASPLTTPKLASTFSPRGGFLTAEYPFMMPEALAEPVRQPSSMGLSELTFPTQPPAPTFQLKLPVRTPGGRGSVRFAPEPPKPPRTRNRAAPVAKPGMIQLPVVQLDELVASMQNMSVGIESDAGHGFRSVKDRVPTPYPNTRTEWLELEGEALK